MYAIEAENVGKRYYVQGMGQRTLFNSLAGAFRGGAKKEFWALRNLNFKVPKGKTVGVVGPNGSGKSTLLGLVAGTITPTEGVVRTQGRISSLLELGAGFHPDLSGRENVYLNASILGIPRDYVQKRFDYIVEFAGLRDFIDTPVKHYSSGMYVRLGFAVAVEMDPDILLIDEVLAVGDAAFQMKCLDRVRQFQKKGKTLFLVSHALETVGEFCDEVMLIHDGQLLDQGDPSTVILSYLKSYMVRIGMLNVEEHGTRDVEIEEALLLDETGTETNIFEAGGEMIVEVHYKAKKPIDKPVFGFNIKTGNGIYVFGSNTQISKTSIEFIDGRGTMRLRIAPLTLKRGNFFLSLSIHSWDHATQFHRLEDWYPFIIRDASESPGLVHLNTQWELEPEATGG
ncbi:ABC transporter ATP-binding protein [Desulfonatronum sp. SC1]|uniref:ABC transporter ATP-binding protein n=1 Tax=Desulfonatronum sp. SC1 TaxID=2109626 RepID=UPI000D316E7D|nr:ABC transporter ATP-binding protein [Desulfonatronum sp. SC1]PTN36787.1 ABC transporter ATP-binding protein [Desulfonatronum sp. SC1]